MAFDDFVVSVTQNTPTDLAQGRPWQVGAYIRRIGVYAPAAATNGSHNLIGDDSEQLPAGTQPVGTAPSASPALEERVIDYTATRQWRCVFTHAGAAAQNIRVLVDYEQVSPANVVETQ